MEQFSAAERAELYYLSIAAVEARFQYWLTITFAAVVAGFVGARYAGIRLRRLAATLCVVASVFFCFALFLIRLWVRRMAKRVGGTRRNTRRAHRELFVDAPLYPFTRRNHYRGV